MLDLTTFRKDPRYLVLAALFLYFLYNFFSSASTVSFIPGILIAIVFGAVVELALFKVEKRPIVFPLSAVVTSSILSLVFLPVLSQVHWTLFAVLAALLSKHFIKMNYSHVFNPANFGALAVSFLPVGVSQTWWAASHPLLVGLMGLLIIHRINAWFITLPFLLTTLALEALRMLVFGALNPAFLFAVVSSGTVLFFSTVMLVEPMTTPVHSKSKAAFGILAGILAFVFSFFLPEVAFLGSLAISNLLTTKLDEFFTPKNPSA
ncbi:RnfABCDGE type electron transport complex subunit D [Candidatus Micrarchaeota archaeon]|nr:RnfABCDGE type electron transport complex subunit D [Candidatus Micrarchaeota archaeon]